MKNTRQKLIDIADNGLLPSLTQKTIAASARKAGNKYPADEIAQERLRQQMIEQEFDSMCVLLDQISTGIVWH